MIRTVEALPMGIPKYYTIGELLSSHPHGRALKVMLLAGVFPALLGAYILLVDFIAALGIKTGVMRAGLVLWLTPMMLSVFGADEAFARAACVAIKYRDTPVCLDTFVCTDTPQSSFVRQICYDATKSYMLIKLNETWYHYCSVDRASIDGLIHANSVGTYYNQHFRSQGPVHGPFDCRDHPVPDYP